MTPLPRWRPCKALCLLCCIVLFQPCLSQARNGDDWVLVQRFQAQLKQAQSGDPSAMFEVARMYERGRGTKPSMSQAIHWYQRAIAKGQNNALAQLGVIFFDGKGVKQDRRKALSLLKPAAEKGNATAQYYLGRMYEQGQGLRRDLDQAKYWYRLAAKNGYYLAIDRLKVLKHTEANPSRTQAATARAPRNASKVDSPAQVLLRTIMKAKWVHNGRASSFLPSASTKCHRKNNQLITCKSGEQQRNIGDAIISYTSDATLSGFTNADAFQVAYVNTVTKVKPVAKPGVDGQTTTPRRPPNIPIGKQSVTHKLRCELHSINKLVCVKDNNVTDVYTRAK